MSAPGRSSGDKADGDQRQSALRTSAFLRSFSDSSTDLRLVIKPNGEVFFANSAAVKAFGYSEEEMFSLLLADLFPARYGEAVLADPLSPVPHEKGQAGPQQPD